jgi:hypothetical protein
MKTAREVKVGSGTVQRVKARCGRTRDKTLSVQLWSTDVGEAVSQATTSAKSLVASGSQSLQHIVMDKQERDKVLLGAAAVALTAALGLVCLRRA